MTDYEARIVSTFQELCKQNGGASPHEVTQLMAEREQLAQFDTVIDIADQMRALRSQGLL